MAACPQHGPEITRCLKRTTASTAAEEGLRLWNQYFKLQMILPFEHFCVFTHSLRKFTQSVGNSYC